MDWNRLDLNNLQATPGPELKPLLSGQLLPCHGCGAPTDVNLLDAKDDGTGNFTVLECEPCYGPGWEPMAWEDPK